MHRAALALCLLCSLATAGTQTEKAAGLSITVPAGWKVDAKPAGLAGESKDKDVAVLAWPVDSGDDAANQKKLEGELYGALANLKFEKATTGKVHDLAATYLTGAGKGKQGPITVKAVVVGPSKTKKWLLVALAVKTDKLEAHQAELQAILDSVQPAK